MAVRGTLLFLAATSFAIALLCADAAAQTEAAPKTFDVASIHINHTETDGHHHIINDPAESHFRTVNLALRDLIRERFYRPAMKTVVSMLNNSIPLPAHFHIRIQPTFHAARD